MMDAVIAKLTYMTHGRIGVDWNSGRLFVLNTKGNEFSALCEAATALRASRTREASLLDALEQARKERDEAEDFAKEELARLKKRGAKLRAQRDAAQKDAKDARALIEDIKQWAKQRCPCDNDEPKICPLCSADVATDRCMAVDVSFPRALCARIEAMLEQKP